MASSLITELVTAATEAQNVTGENFTFKSNTYSGVIGDAPITMALTEDGYGQSAQAILFATASQFTTLPNKDDATARELIVHRSKTWKVVSVEDDGLHIKFGLTINQ